jgi:hypothetical protein
MSSKSKSGESFLQSQLKKMKSKLKERLPQLKRAKGIKNSTVTS